MDKKEKIRKIYEKNGISVDDNFIEYKMKDKEIVKQFMRIYKEEELESMNYILGKSKDNKYFTQFELELLNKIDLFNRKVVEICKNIYEREILGGAN